MRCSFGILAPMWTKGDPTQFEEDLTGWDTAINEYERQANKRVEEEVRLAVVTQHAPPSCRQVVLQAAAQAGGTYAKFREIILTFLRTNKHFSASGAQGPAPMYVGAIGSKGKDKGSKGGWQPWNKGKGKGDGKTKGGGKKGKAGGGAGKR